MEDPVKRRENIGVKLCVALQEPEVTRGGERVEVAVRDQVPGLAVLREIIGECEVLVLDHGPHEVAHQLQAKQNVANPPDTAPQLVALWWERRRSPLASMVAGRDHDVAHEPNLTVRIGE